MVDYNTDSTDLKKVLDDTLKELAKVQDEAVRLRLVLSSYSIPESEMYDISDEEVLCVSQISKLKEFTDNGGVFDKNQAEIFKILTSQLRSIRNGQAKAKKPAPTKPMSTDELMKVVQGGKV